MMKQKKCYEVHRFGTVSSIDWQSVPKAAIDCYGWTKPQDYDAYGQLVYVTDVGLVARMVCKEADPVVNYHQDKDPVYMDSAMEFFVKLGDAGYINLETNAVGARLQEFGKDRGDRALVFDVISEGFCVEAGREDACWTLLLKLPLESLRKFYPDINNTVFSRGFRFSGNFYKIGTVPEHYGMWNEVKTETPDFHRPDHFGDFVMCE